MELMSNRPEARPNTEELENSGSVLNGSNEHLNNGNQPFQKFNILHDD